MAKEAKEKDWIVWLSRDAGEAFLGLSSSRNNETSRYCVMGKMKEEAPAGFGVWVEIDEVQERSIPDSGLMKTFTVRPKTCLIPWGFISYVQRGRHSQEVGFVQAVDKSA
jgi:hypothetical protein